MAALAEDFVDEEDLQIFKERYEKEETAGMVTNDIQFQYGMCLIKSKYRNDIRKGIELFQDLCTRGCDQRDFLFFLALGYYKLGQWEPAMKCIQRLLNIEPNNHQAIEMKELINKKMNKDGLMGVAIAGGAVVGGILGIVGGSIILGYKLLKK
ncbi:mitochondrial fission 1 protein-like [Rhopilema esculentum]|uniref:mitochondrial fission 1 protein-like n=1 Tax=Rhopilema esculentum TaxID=499914 RepID=UPI0031CDC68A